MSHAGIRLCGADITQEGREEISGRQTKMAARRLWFPATGPCEAVNLLLTIRVHLAAHGAGARWSSGMSEHHAQADGNLLSAFAFMIGGALGAALPMTIVIIWICS
jgi:hypothetical protein